ncbi:transglycosylase domain-containing protein [Bacillus sp. Au-Bac7]|uniref:transglycosylase domain-containing protein n=1 Tax=Bacillus sp. Au-Bac7 TaxID=2906458 RepID=UPI001E4A991F|nr:transglycosylase domain-containing protein [Bacillus sp. Au-Bac7]MCE4051312.1 transglycosylase domain-containing protein [Bacillus sp. Au-Bac7]
MNESPKWKNYLHGFLSFFTNKKTAKRARITYEVSWNIILIFIILLIVGGAFAGGIGAGYFASLVKEEPIRSYKTMQKDIYNYEETSELYFADNVYLGKLPTDLEREEVQIEDVSPYLVDAIVATEDENFYKHDGVVPKAIMRALVQEVSNSSTQSGGSTLTQQLIKNQILTNEVSFERKAKEILLALRLEKFFSKEEILQAYLNVSTFGRNASGRNIAGVQSAAKGIFGVEAKDLTLPQAAFIAGLPQSPFGYTPFTQDGTVKKNLEPGLERLQTVLTRMYNQHKITKEEYEKASAYDITKDFASPEASPTEKYPWVTYEIENRATQIIAEMLAKEDGYNAKDLEEDEVLEEQYYELADRQIHQNGYEIHSTINKKMYDKFQDVVAKYPYYGPDKPQTVTNSETGEKKTIMEPVETGAVLIDNKTGAIISFVGGRDYDREATNHSTAPRPNGSTMKPLLVYGPAIELGTLSPGTVLPDVPLALDPARPGTVWPNNYDFQFHGLVTARVALAKSYNVPAVKAYAQILPQKPATYLEKMGFSTLTDADYSNRATSIGGITNGVSVEENTNAFATFANGGEFVDAYMIDKIVDKDGKVIYKHKAEKVKVFSPQTSYLTIDMMRDVINQGTATAVKSRLKFSSDWAGKTGTTQEFKDSWFVATNPNVSFGVWTGYDTPKSLQSSGTMSYSMRNNYLWADLMNAAYDVDSKLVDPSESFTMPGGIVRRSVCSLSGLLASEGCSKAGLVTTDLFKANAVPNKTDDSIVAGKYVQIGDTKYMALDSTPSEFAENGVILNPDYIEKLFGITVTDPSTLIQNNTALKNVVVPSNKITDNGKAPGAPKISSSGNTITWSRSGEKDVIGYRVYQNGKKVASIKASDSLSYRAGSGAYIVKAVDIAGKESSNSNKIEVGNKTSDKKEENSKAKADTAKNTEKKEENKTEASNEDKNKQEQTNDESTDSDKEDSNAASEEEKSDNT